MTAVEAQWILGLSAHARIPAAMTAPGRDTEDVYCANPGMLPGRDPRYVTLRSGRKRISGEFCGTEMLLGHSPMLLPRLEGL